MALNLKTPGVYTQEVSLLPPSVAAVETAIPAFIGYTQIPGETTFPTSDPNWLPVPVRITSMLDYVNLFGTADNQSGISANVVGSSISVSGPDSNNSPKYLMYYCLQMYFANGGGPCYIASVGSYSNPASVTLNELNKGLTAIGMEDEPTLLLFPDAKSLSEADFYAIYTNAINQSHDLKDRFTILDTYGDESLSVTNNPIKRLRNGISSTTEYLKYSAAYYPYLSTIIDYQYRDQDVAVTLVDENDYATLAQNIADQISTVDLNSSILAFSSYITANTGNLFTQKPEINGKVLNISGTIKSTRNLVQQVITIGQNLVANAANPADPDIVALNAAVNAMQTWSTNRLEGREFSLLQATNTINSAADEAATNAAITDTDPLNPPVSVYEILGFDPATPSAIGVVDDINQVDDAAGDPLFDLIDAIGTVSPAPAPVVTTLAAIKDTENVIYNQIKAQISQLPIVLPPSSTMAGIYAKVDNNNGVWTSPANVGLNYVLKPTQVIDNAAQEDMNVTSTGKSVNAIRSFTGRGTLVWGARTMAGNDNEWRYISVRRLFNFLEESISEASEQFVFQPNDANTWVKMQGMIENFLINQWKAGALAGAKAEQAFYVNVGLGKTMTSQDILEGSMIIEIGIAAVRPAEFIVLKFTHKMQEA